MQHWESPSTLSGCAADWCKPGAAGDLQECWRRKGPLWLACSCAVNPLNPTPCYVLQDYVSLELLVTCKIPAPCKGVLLC